MLRAIAAAVLAAGLASAGATMVVLAAGAADNEWIAWAERFGVTLALAFLPAAIGSSLVMPRTSDLQRPNRPANEAGVRLWLHLLLTALAALSVLQAPAIASWWVQDLALLGELTGGPDPLGLFAVPAGMLFSMLALAAAALLTFVLTSVVGALAGSPLVSRALFACVLLQAGLVAGEHVLLGELHNVQARLSPVLDRAGDPAVTASAAAWFARHDAASDAVSRRLIWILGGYLFATALGALASQRSEYAAQATGARLPAAHVAAGPPFSAGPAALASHEPASAASQVFDDSSYAIKPRGTLLESLFAHSYTEYDIQTIPPSSRARFSFSWRTGIVRREPNGPDLVALRSPEGQRWFRARAYDVTDLATGSLLGRLSPGGSAWEILDVRGGTIAEVVELTEGAGFARYVARAGDDDLCRFTWGFQGVTVHSAEMEVEFLSASNGRLDRAMAIALGPILEQRARRTSRQSMPS